MMSREMGTDLRISIPQFNGNIPLQFVLEPNGLYTGDGFYDLFFS